MEDGGNSQGNMEPVASPPGLILWGPVEKFGLYQPGVEGTPLRPGDTQPVHTVCLSQPLPQARRPGDTQPVHAVCMSALDGPWTPVEAPASGSNTPFHGHSSAVVPAAACPLVPANAISSIGVGNSMLMPVKEEPVGSVPITVSQEGLVPPIMVSQEELVPPVTVCEEGVVNLWRAIGSAKGYSTDTDLAKFLMTLYMNYEDPGPGSVRTGDLTAARQQTDIQTVVHLSQEVGSQTDWPSFRDGKSQTEIQCSKCTRLMALVCINRQCQRSPVAAAATGTLLQAEPSGVGRVTGRSSGDEMDVEEFSGFEAESSAEDSDLDTVMSEGYPAQAKQPLAISKKKAQNKKRARANPVVNSLQPIVKLRKCDFTKHATQTSAYQTARADHSAFGSQGTKDKAIKRKSNVSLEFGAGPIQKLQVIFNEAESGKRTTADRSDEDSRENTGQADSDEDSREKTDHADRDEDCREKTGQADPATRSAESDGCPDTKRQGEPVPRDDKGKTATSPPAIFARRETATSSQATSARQETATSQQSTSARQETGTSQQSTSARQETATSQQSTSARRETATSQQSTSARRETATSPRAKSARRSTRSSGPLEVVQPTEQPVTTATGKYPIVDGVAYKNGKIPNSYFVATEFRCSRCDKTFPSRVFIRRHIKNPSCDDGNDHMFFQNYGKNNSSITLTPAAAAEISDVEWTPESAPTKDKVKEIKIKKPKTLNRYRSKKEHTLQEFMAGKVHVPLYFYGKLGKSKGKRENWYFSHYTCFKCYTVFQIKRLQFLKHVEECDGIRDRDTTAGKRVTLVDVDMATEDAQSTEDLAKTNADDQLTNNLAKTTADDQLTKDLANTTADGQLTKDLAKTTADDQLTNDLAKTAADGQLTNDLAQTTADGQLTNDLAKTTADDQLTNDLAQTTADGQLAEDLAQTTADGQLTNDLAQTTADGQLTNDLAQTTADGQLTKDGADQCQTDQPWPQPGGEDRQLDPESIEILMRVKERYLHCCPHCDIVFFNKEQLKMHAVAHFYSEETSGTFSCQLCSETFQKRLQILKHLQIPKKKGSQCKQCGLSYQARCQMYPHMIMHMKEKTALKAQARAEAKALELPNPHPRKNRVSTLCPVCGKICDDTRALKNHMRSHSDEKPYACSVCGTTFKEESTLQGHEAAHDGAQFQCQDCGKEFFTKQTFNHHRRVKHMGLICRCEYCGKVLSSKLNLKQHITQVHLKIKSYTCSVCDFRGSRKCDLDIHMRKHTGEKPFQCDTCLSSFARVDYLNKHMRLHTGERPYTCDDCPQSFVCATSLKHHRLRQHSDKTFPCDVCDKVLYSSVSRDHHKYTAHGGAFRSPKSRKLFPCHLCCKVLHTAASLDFHLGKHKDSDQKRSEDQESDQKSSEHQESDQKSSEHQESDQKSSEHQESDQKSSEHQDSDQKSSEHHESDQKSSEHHESNSL